MGQMGSSWWLEKAYGISYVDLTVTLGLSVELEGWGTGQKKHWGVCMKGFGGKFMKASLHSSFIGICT